MATASQTASLLLLALGCFCTTLVRSSPSYHPGNNKKTTRDVVINREQLGVQRQIPDGAAFPHPSEKSQGSSADKGDTPCVEDLQSKDGVDMPPQFQKIINDYYNNLVDESEKNNDVVNDQPKDNNGRRYKRSEYGYSHYGGYGDNSYGDDSYSYGGYGGNGYGYEGLKKLITAGHGYGKGLHLPNKVGYSHGYTKSPLISFVKGFKPGKTYVDKGHVIRNYFRHGSYNVALQHYKLIPTVKVVPYTTYKKIGVGQKVEAKYRYKAYICKYCYHGYPKIDVYEMKKPYSYAVRRFVYLPENYKLDSYGHGDSYGSYGYGGDSYGYGGNSYGYGGDSYGYGDDSYGYGHGYGYDSYGKGGYDNKYHHDSYGYGGDSYGYGGNSYGYGGDSYGYGGDSYGYGGDSYGYGGDSYGYGGDSYGYGGNSYGYGGDSYGYGGRPYSNGNSYDYKHGYGYGKAKVTYHNYPSQSYYGAYGYGSYGSYKK